MQLMNDFTIKELSQIHNMLMKVSVPHTDEGLEEGKLLNSICKKCVSQIEQRENEDNK